MLQETSVVKRLTTCLSIGIFISDLNREHERINWYFTLPLHLKCWIIFISSCHLTLVPLTICYSVRRRLIQSQCLQCSSYICRVFRGFYRCLNANADHRDGFPAGTGDLTLSKLTQQPLGPDVVIWSHSAALWKVTAADSHWWKRQGQKPSCIALFLYGYFVCMVK